MEALVRALEDLRSGEMRRQRTGTGAPPKIKDPFAEEVTRIVVRKLYDIRRAANPKYTFFEAKKEVGNGVEYLDKVLEAKIAEGGDRGTLEKSREEEYFKPVRAYLTRDKSKAMKDLPSLL
jgi:hypothetical protein